MECVLHWCILNGIWTNFGEYSSFWWEQFSSLKLVSVLPAYILVLYNFYSFCALSLGFAASVLHSWYDGSEDRPGCPGATGQAEIAGRSREDGHGVSPVVHPHHQVVHLSLSGRPPDWGGLRLACFPVWLPLSPSLSLPPSLVPHNGNKKLL